ncbi:hypothetical protein EV642_121104 [Kribbella sp. VKM Ac-2500]|uniref:hypothetical protein n=1 Tax=Kribbella sp. VKM Ac-2500 TaxID=2512214 RepID=UPI001045F4BF|nr:hypothetical protein [Kribbella sp. VKM Ac-2500]TCN34467.1 hypothetical protein EV642_121104 [Kribbella sp. VKM Ac-2500]
MLDELVKLIVPAPEFRFAANKLHGDEIIHRGRVFTEADDGWLESANVEAVLRDPAVVPVLLHCFFEGDTVGMHHFDGPAWRSFVLANYIRDDGYPPVGSDVSLVAHRWIDPTGHTLLIFELDC